jgi:uncharacterized membrane protein SpoIIM required for sporulation
MVLESLINPKNAEGHPFEMLLLGFLYASIALFLSLWIFNNESAIVMVLLTVIASLPLMYNIIKQEEEKDIQIASEMTLLKQHAKALNALTFLFIGFVLAFSLWYVILPSDIAESAFSAQIKTIQQINSNSVSDLSATAAASAHSSLFLQIFANNIKVLLFCIFFAFFYGAGAIFILTWNATVISAAIGNFFRTNLSSYANTLGFVGVASYFQVFSLALLRYLLHGIPEIIAYFIGGLAGGIISIAVIKHEIGTKRFRHILFDSMDLVLLAVFVLFVAGLIEVYATPLFF